MSVFMNIFDREKSKNIYNKSMLAFIYNNIIFSLEKEHKQKQILFILSLLKGLYVVLSVNIYQSSQINMKHNIWVHSPIFFLPTGKTICFIRQ